MSASPWRQWARQLPALRHTAVVPAPGDPMEAAVGLSRAVAGTAHVVYERDGTWYFATAPAVTLTAHATGVTASAAGQRWDISTGGRPVDAVAQALAALPPWGWRAYGWAAFELGHLLHADPAGAGAEPLMHLALPTIEIELTRGRAHIRATDKTTLSDAAALVAQPTPPRHAETSPPLPGPEDLLAQGSTVYRAAVAATITDIGNGLLHKAVLSRALPLPESVDLAATYLAGRRANTPARSYLLDLGGWQAAGFSPETVVEVDAGGRVATQPLAGTRALGPDPHRNHRLAEELLTDAKEVHEHALSVRLAHDELTGVCRPGSVAIEEFMTIRERGSVQHLASRVAGQLRDGTTAWHAFAALFPAITATGVPKPAALRALRRHETGPRGLYGGAVFMAGADGSLDAALVLRTVFRHQGRSWLRAGAGIMGRSTPAREWEETCEKLRSVAPFLRLEQPTPPVPAGPAPVHDTVDRALATPLVELRRRTATDSEGRNR